VNGSRLALIGAAWGTVGAAVLVGVGLADAGPELRFEPLDSVAVAVTATGPYALSLFVMRARPSVRAGVWLGCGVAASLVAAGALSASTLVLLPAAILLVVGGAMGVSEAHRTGLAVAMAAVVLVGAAGAFLARFASEDPRCWKLTRTANGPAWVEAPVERGPGLGQALGSADLRGACTSDVATPSEAGGVLGIWAALGVAVAVTGRQGGIPARAAA